VDFPSSTFTHTLDTKDMGAKMTLSTINMALLCTIRSFINKSCGQNIRTQLYVPLSLQSLEGWVNLFHSFEIHRSNSQYCLFFSIFKKALDKIKV